MRTTLILLVLASLVVVGCGDDERPALTSSELTTKASAICTKVAATLKMAMTNQTYDRLATVSDQALSDLTNLTPPKDRTSDYDAYVKAQTAVVEADKPYIKALEANDKAAQAKLAPAVTAADNASDAAAAAAGLPACGDPSK